METIKNLSYEVKINYIDDSGENVFINKKIFDNGLDIETTQVGDIAITEEKIKGRILSGLYEDKKINCGFRYNYDGDEDTYLVGTNRRFSVNDSANLINKTKMSHDFVNAMAVLYVVMRNECKIFSVNDGDIFVEKLISAENEKAEQCSVKENIKLSKLKNENGFYEAFHENVYSMGDETVVENKKENSELKQKLNQLVEILNKKPNNYYKLIEAKESVQPNFGAMGE